MKKNVLMLLAVTALLFIGCTKMEQVYPVPSGELSNVPVDLSGVINEGGTRAPVTGLTSDLPLSVFRADATYGTTYTKLENAGTLTAAGKVTMSPKQYYLVDASKNSKFFAVYPETGTFAQAANTVEFPIDGTTDILTGSLVEGNKTQPVGQMKFRHLLTQVRVVVVADGTDAEKTAILAAWGKINSITLTGKATTALVTLPLPTATAGETTVATIAQKPGAAENLLPLEPVYGTGGMTIPTTTATEFGYAMFLPVATPAALQLNITSELSGTPKSVSTGLTPFTAGNKHVITITFRAGGTVLVSVDGGGALTNWTDGDPASGELS